MSHWGEKYKSLKKQTKKPVISQFCIPTNYQLNSVHPAVFNCSILLLSLANYCLEFVTTPKLSIIHLERVFIKRKCGDAVLCANFELKLQTRLCVQPKLPSSFSFLNTPNKSSTLLLSRVVLGRWQTVCKPKRSAVASKIPFCVKKEMWKQLGEECHLCPDCQRGLVQRFRVRPEAAGRQTDAQTPGSPIMC